MNLNIQNQIWTHTERVKLRPVIIIGSVNCEAKQRKGMKGVGGLMWSNDALLMLISHVCMV